MPANRQRCYLHAPRIFTGSDDQILDDVAIEVSDGAIVGLIPYRDVVNAPDKNLISYPDCTILPGLVDAHCHVTLTGDGATYEQQVLDPDEMMSLIAVSNLSRHLNSGVTTIRDNGGRNRVVFVVREAAKRGYIRAPRMLLAGRPVTHSYGHFYWCNGVADGEVEIRAAVRQLVAEGADHIKIMASGGATAGNIPYYPSYTADELRVAVEAAHTLGRLTTAHCRATSSIENAVEAGLDCVEHAEFLQPGDILEFGPGVASSGIMKYDPKVAEKLYGAGTFVSFTAQTGGYETLLRLRAATDGKQNEDARLRIGALEAYFDMKLGILSSLLDDGFASRIAISTDAGPYDVSFGGLQHGLELAVQAGMSPAAAIRSATAVAARACGVDKQTGTLEPGKAADILVVRGNPVADIKKLWDVEAVYLAGHLVAPIGARSLAEHQVFDLRPTRLHDDASHLC